MTTELSSVAREAAEAEGLRRIPPQWMVFHGGTTADQMAVYRSHFIDGFTKCASRLPSEREIARALAVADDQVLSGLTDHMLDFIYGKQARAVLSLIGEKIMG